jgi:glycosyltransferase involved in cell wall biosynthesis
MTVPVSVVIPALNAERFIGQAIESVHAQTLKGSEIIVVDNGCTDRTAQIATEMGANVVVEWQRGLSRARNAGIRESTQEWIALLDSDDLWDAEKMERQWLAIVEKTLISCRRHDQKHSFNLQGMRESVFSIVNYMLQHPEKYPTGGPQVYRDLLKKNFLTIERALQRNREIGLPVK